MATFTEQVYVDLDLSASEIYDELLEKDDYLTSFKVYENSDFDLALSKLVENGFKLSAEDEETIIRISKKII